MKELVFGGVCHFPEHPFADMHGLIRFCIKTTGPGSVIRELERYGVTITMREFNHTWGPSKSAAELDAASHSFREVLFCKLVHAYMVSDYYKLDKSQFLSIRQERERLAKVEGEKVAHAPRPERKVQFP